MRLYTAALASLFAVAALGCDSNSSADPELSMRLNGQYVMGNQTVMQYSPDTSPQLVLSRSMSGNGMTLYFTFPKALEPGTYSLSGASATGNSVRVVADRGVAAANLPAQASHRVTAGTITLTSVSETSVSGTFESTVNDGAAGHTLTGRFRAMR